MKKELGTPEKSFADMRKEMMNKTMTGKKVAAVRYRTSIRENIMSNPIIYCDMDGVLADFKTAAIRVTNMSINRWMNIPSSKNK